MAGLFAVSITSKIGNTVMNGTHACMESVAQLSFGQTFLRFVDRFLWIVEKSAQWSLPHQDENTDDDGKSFGPITLVRPLPWIFFLPGLILLRVFRAAVNVGAFVLGYPKLEASHVVKYMQKSRRRLRTIKSNGMKFMRKSGDYSRTKDCEKIMSTDAKWKSIQLLRSIQLTLSSLSCLDRSKLSPSPPPTKIKIRMNHESTPTPEEKSTTESASSLMHVEYKRRYSQVSSNDYSSEDSEDETLQAKIDRVVALDNSLDDDDYNPPESLNSDGDSSCYSGESSISASEIMDVMAEANILRRAIVGVTEIIKEEPEPIKRGDENEKTDVNKEFASPINDCASENSEDNLDYESPCKMVEDGAFYSPVSSKSPSPDRTVQASEKIQQDKVDVNVGQTTSPRQNGEMNNDSKAQVSGSPNKTTNGHGREKIATSTNANPTKSHKSHNRGRRTGNASRKKK